MSIKSKISISEAIACVAEFHKKLQVSTIDIEMPSHRLPALVEASKKLLEIAKLLEPFGAIDERYNRMHLEIEELGERGFAMAIGNEVEAFDGIVDQLYVLLGTAVAFGWPLEKGFTEVHRSNMTKEKQPNDISSHRIRLKGPNYSPPNLTEILLRHKGEL